MGGGAGEDGALIAERLCVVGIHRIQGALNMLCAPVNTGGIKHTSGCLREMGETLIGYYNVGTKQKKAAPRNWGGLFLFCVPALRKSGGARR